MLPRAQAALARDPEEPSQGDLPSAAPLSILLVDDDHSVRSLTEQMLSELGHNVVMAENGPAALALLSSSAEFDLLLVDFAMPVMNGAQVAAEAIKLRPHLFILFMTGYADISVLSSWTESGYRIVSKPFSAAELDLAIRYTVLSRAKAGNVVSLPRSRN